MGIYDNFADTPNAIIKEGREITLKYERGENNTAIITWNIPAPAAGCGADVPGAYDGIVITVNTKPSNYLSTSPVDSTYYSYDPTADKDLHAGDKIDGALVVGAFYHNKTTNRLVVNNVLEKTPYYFSAYAVDKVGRYHREGVHAYSLPTGEQEGGTPDIAAYQDVGIDIIGGIKPSLKTGLSHTVYTQKISVNDVEYTVSINGVNAINYSDLIKELNKQFALLENPILNETYPFKDHLYLDKSNKKLYKWTGLTHNTIEMIVSNKDPSVPQMGEYWLSGSNLYRYETSGWVLVNAIVSSASPTNLKCGQLWFNGTDVFQWDGNHWCKLCVYIQTRNPLLPPVLSCNTFWYDDTNDLFFKWDEKKKRWREKLVLVSNKDPNDLTTGDFWFNETDKFIYQYVGNKWVKSNLIVYAERNNNNQPANDYPSNTVFWYIPSEKILYRRDNDDLLWVVQEFTSYPTDPMDRKSCDLWWNTETTIDDLYIWDVVNSRWILPDTFFRTSSDPSLAPSLPECAVWFNPTDKTLKVIKDSSCGVVDYIYSTQDPDNLSPDTIWFDGKKFYVYDGSQWIILTPIISSQDPYEIDSGEYWYNPDTGILYEWGGLSWFIVTPSYVPLTPSIGTLWFNLLNDKLYSWNGSIWSEKIPIVNVELIPPSKKDGRSILRFYTRDSGCQYGLEIIQEENDLLSSLAQRVIYFEPVSGSSGLVGGPSYLQLGVGDDGSPDERRELHSKIRSILGAGSVRVELKKEDIDVCINNAIAELRKYSGASVRRGYFFLDLKKNQQTYIMTNKCVGFNKIVDILTIHRMKPGWLKVGSNANNDLFAYAAVQQLYTMGTFDILTYHLVSSYIEELETLFANKITYSWYEFTRELKIQQIIPRNERVLVDATFEKTEQDLISDRQTGLWLQRWAVAEAKQILSQIRGKFQTLPGPSGSTTLNSQELITQAETEKQELRSMLTDWSMQNLHEYGAAPMLIIG
jgi:hypothetical protein